MNESGLSPEPGHRGICENVPCSSREEHNPITANQSQCSSCPDLLLSPKTRLRLLITLIVILLTFEIGGQMIAGPMVRVIEIIACNQYWRHHDPARLPATGNPPEHLCKVAAVQAEVATVKGYSDLLEKMLGTICAIPYGLLADRYGRRRAIHITIPGFLLNAIITNSVLWFSDHLPLRAIWLAAFSWIIGGGPSVALVVIWTMLADLTTDAQRATLFFRVGLIGQAGSLFSSAISSVLMSVDPWIPLLLGCGIILVGLGCALSLPETMRVSKPVSLSSPESSAPYETPPNFGSPYNFFQRKASSLFHPYLFIFNRSLLLLLISITGFQAAQTSWSFFTQYISTRFTWSLARANLLTSLHTAVTILVFLFLLPYLSNKVLHSLPLRRRDLQVARLSDIALMMGSLGIGLSTSRLFLLLSLCFHATGAGFSLVARSLVTDLVKQEETAKLYSVIEIMQMFGGLLGSLCFTNVFRLGLRMSGIGAGLVWVLGGLFYFIIALLLGLVWV